MNDKLRNMEFVFNPKSAAVIGASGNPGKLGYQVMRSLTAGEQPGKIIPINPKREQIMGLKALPSVMDEEGEIDLAVVVLPANQVVATVKECVSKGVKGIILITAGFREIEDSAGDHLQEEIATLANRAGIPIIGPNCFGVFNVNCGMNATFNPEFSSMIKPGKVGLMSQSGGMAGVIGYQSVDRHVGFSKIISLGNRCNVDFADMLSYLMEDSDTEVIAMYVEGIDEPRHLLELASQFRGKKPIIVYKAGRSSVSDLASQSHTGSLAGKFEIYRGAFRQAGFIDVDTSTQLLDVAQALVLSSLPKDPNVAVLSGQAGPAMVICDVCEANGLKIKPFGPKTQGKLNEFLPPLTIRTNPVDLGPAWHKMSVLKSTIQTILEDESVSALLLFFALGETFSGLSELFGEMGGRKPILSSIPIEPGSRWDTEIKSLEESGILVNYPTPERAAMAMAGLWEYSRIRNVAG